MGVKVSDIVAEREKQGRISCELGAGGGNIPVLSAVGGSLAEAWENAMLGLYAYGCRVKTQYDQPRDPESIDCSMRMVVADPASEPLIHRAFPGGLEDLEEYRQEVLEGVKDRWVRDQSDPGDKRWEYTYHERLFAYGVPGIEGRIDQVERVVEYLSSHPSSRRAQAITWKVWEDLGIDDPPCLQSMWFRLLEDGRGALRLNVNVRFRSRDAYDAAFMNCFALVALQESVASRIAARMGRRVTPGRYVDESDSFHVYGRRLADFEERFLGQLRTRSFEERTWTRHFAQPFFEEARPGIALKIAQQSAKYAGR